MKPFSQLLALLETQFLLINWPNLELSTVHQLYHIPFDVGHIDFFYCLND